MDIQTTVLYLNTDDEFTDEYGKRHKVNRINRLDTPKGGYYVYVEGQSYPEFYLYTHKITKHIPDAKFKPGDMVIARSGKGDVYQINRVFRNRWNEIYYVFDNGSVSPSKRGRSGWHPANRADRGYKVVTDAA